MKRSGTFSSRLSGLEQIRQQFFLVFFLNFATVFLFEFLYFSLTKKFDLSCYFLNFFIFDVFSFGFFLFSLKNFNFLFSIGTPYKNTRMRRYFDIFFGIKKTMIFAYFSTFFIFIFFFSSLFSDEFKIFVLILIFRNFFLLFDIFYISLLRFFDIFFSSFWQFF